MTAETEWPYALTLTCADGPREFRFRVDPVEPPLPFGRIGEPSGCRMPVDPDSMIGMIVAERHFAKPVEFWGLCDWAEVVALAVCCRDAGMGRLGAEPNFYLMPRKGAASPLLVVTEAHWSRWKGEALNPPNVSALPGFEVTEHGAARKDGDA